MNTELEGMWTQKWMLRPVANCCRGSRNVRVAPALLKEITNEKDTAQVGQYF